MLDALLQPKSVVLVGASADKRKIAGKSLVRLEQHHFPGDIYLVNPRYESIDGRPCYPSIDAVGRPIDVALISLPASAVPATVRECGRAGVEFAVVISSGFGEDAASGALSDALSAAVAESGVRLVGPNCEGIWSLPASMALTFGSAADRPELIAGPVSVISQSGSIGGACMRHLQEQGIGCRYFISSGNEADLNSMDYLEYIVDEGGSRVVALFIEGLVEGHRLRAIGRRAASRGIRLIALCAGTSEEGRLATASHTGRIASAAAVYRDVLEVDGVLQVDTFTDFVKAIEAATFGRLPPVGLPPRHDAGVGIVALSGGSRGLLADSCERLGVPLARYHSVTEQALDDMLPQFGFSKNPTDLTGQVLADPPLFGRVLSTVIDDPHTEALVVQYANGAERQLGPQVEFYRDLVARTDKPVVVSVLGSLNGDLAQQLQEAGVVWVSDPSDAVRFLAWLYRWRGFQLIADQPSVPEIAAQEQLPSETWEQRMELLEAAGIPVVPWRIWDGSDGDDEVLGELRFPLVVKALPGTAEHKTESGLVFVGIRNRSELDSTLESFTQRAGRGTPALIQEMVQDAVEVLLSARTDPDLGPVLAIGSGGVQTEWLRDVTYLPLPASEEDVRAAIGRLRLIEMLGEFRGRPARDLAALTTAASGLGIAYLKHLPKGSEIEINPLMVGQTGVTAVDVLCAGPVTDAVGVTS